MLWGCNTCVHAQSWQRLVKGMFPQYGIVRCFSS